MSIQYNYETNKIVSLINDMSGQITSDILNDLIKSNKEDADKMKKSWNEFSGDVAIKSRTFPDPNKVNNKLANDFRGLITNQLTSYVFGNPIKYRLDNTSYDDNSYSVADTYIQKFLKRNNVSDMDVQTGEMASVCGKAYRLLYIDKNGEERFMNINPWEVIYVKDQTIDEVQYAMIYYQVEINEGNQTYTVYRVEWYDDNNVTFYIQDRNGNFGLDINESINPLPHLFKNVPIIKFDNNNLQQSDFESVATLIDAYDKTTSDMQNEIEEFRLAYLAFYGTEPTAETIRLARQTGAFAFPEGTDAKFITKQINDTFLENHKMTLERNILKFASTVDYSDEAFSGTSVSGESRKWKLLAQENLAKMKERKFTKGLYDMFKVLESFMELKQISINYEDMNFIFTRSLPVELITSADLAIKLQGIVSEETILGLMPFVDDVQQEMERKKSEKQENSNFISLSDITAMDNSNDING